MARITSQIKSTGSLVLATSASVCFGLAARRWDANGKNWIPFAFVGCLCLIGQLTLTFIESKEEAFFSLHRRLQDLKVQEDIIEAENRIAEAEVASKAIQAMLHSGKVDEAEKIDTLRRNLHGR